MTLSSILAGRTLGWRPRLDIDRALVWTADWYRAFESKENVLSVSNAQIERYESLGRA